MKTCANCRAIWADDYMGQCTDCGRPMASDEPNGDNGLAFRFARQLNDARMEGAMETRMKRGNYDGVKVSDTIVRKASEFVTYDPSKVPDGA